MSPTWNRYFSYSCNIFVPHVLTDVTVHGLRCNIINKSKALTFQSDFQDNSELNSVKIFRKRNILVSQSFEKYPFHPTFKTLRHYFPINYNRSSNPKLPPRFQILNISPYIVSRSKTNANAQRETFKNLKILILIAMNDTPKSSK